MTALDCKYKVHSSSNFWEQRVVLAPFKESTDVDPKSKKSGICTYWRIIALILRLFGCVKIVDIPVKLANGEIKVLYLNRKSLDKWLARHHGETAQTSEEYVNSIQKILNGYLESRKSQFLVEENDSSEQTAMVVRPQTPPNTNDPKRAAKKVILKKLANEVERQFKSPSYQKNVDFTDFVKKLAIEAEQFCYDKSGQLNDFDLRYKKFQDKHKLREPAALLERAERLTAGLKESDPGYESTKKEADKFADEAKIAAKQINNGLFNNSSICSLTYNYGQQKVQPEAILRETKIEQLPVDKGVFFFGATPKEIISIKTHGFAQPNLHSVSTPSHMGLGLKFYISKERALQPLLLEHANKLRTNTLQAEIKAVKIGYVENYLALESLRDYFTVVAKAYLEMNGEGIHRKAGRTVSTMQLGDALMARFFTRKGYDAVYFSTLGCLMVYKPEIAKAIRTSRK